MRMIASILTALTLTAAAPAMAFDADARQVANKADRLASAADQLAAEAYGHGRAGLGNRADDLRREAIQLADAAFWASNRRGSVLPIIRPEWQDTRAAFQDLQDRWQQIAPNVRDPQLRQAWQATRSRFQTLRAEIRE